MNLTEEQKSYLIGKRYENEKKLVSNSKGNNQFKKVVGDENHLHPLTKDERSTAGMVGKEYGIGSDTVKKNEKFSKGLDLLPEEIKNGILSDEIKESKEDIKQIAKLSVNDYIVFQGFICKLIRQNGFYLENLHLIGTQKV